MIPSLIFILQENRWNHTTEKAKTIINSRFLLHAVKYKTWKSDSISHILINTTAQ